MALEIIKSIDRISVGKTKMPPLTMRAHLLCFIMGLHFGFSVMFVVGKFIIAKLPMMKDFVFDRCYHYAISGNFFIHKFLGFGIDCIRILIIRNRKDRVERTVDVTMTHSSLCPVPVYIFLCWS